MRLLSALLAALLLPLAAFGVASIPYWHSLEMRDPAAMFGAALTCLSYDGADAGFQGACEQLNLFSYLGIAAIAVGGLGVALLIVVMLVARFTGFSRFLISLTFPLLTFLALVCAGVIALGQAGLLAASTYLLQSYFFGSVFIYIVVVIALTGAGVGFAVLWRALRMFRNAESRVIGVPLDPSAAPSIHGLVERISTKFKTDKPENIVVGFDPTFFATSAAIYTPVDKRPLRGETLYLSLPLLRMLSEEEVTSIVGHELAHFSGSDTVYSKRFAPAYRGLYEAMHELSTARGAARGLLAIPVRIVVRFVLSSFEPAEKRISRSRELRADELGARAGSPESLCSALVKLSVLSALWNLEFREMVARVQKGRFTRNMSLNFVERARYDVDHDKAAGFVAKGLDTETAHPTDTHPITRLRIEKLGLEPATFVELEAFKKSMRPLKLITSSSDRLDEIEEKLTDLYQQIVIRQLGVDESNRARNDAAFSNLLSMLLAKMVVADGKVEESEIQVAHEQGGKYDPNFDAVIFREFCRHPETIPDLDKMVEWGNMILTRGGASRLKDVLKAIALADGEYDEAERSLFEILDSRLVGADPTPPAEPDRPLADERVGR